jgi:hypothetical protein
MVYSDLTTVCFCWKEKCTLVQTLRLCTGRTAHRGSRGIALLFHDHDTRRRWGVSVTPRPFFTPGKDPIPIVQEVGWAPGPVWKGGESLAPIGIRSPARPARSQSLYPAHIKMDDKFIIQVFNVYQGNAAAEGLTKRWFRGVNALLDFVVKFNWRVGKWVKSFSL